MHFPTSNNATEYEALLHGLRIATALDINWLRVLGDSLLIVNPTNKEWSCLDDKMMMYCQKLRKLENNFDSLKYMYILWGKNDVTDEFAKLGSSWAMVPPRVFMQELHEPSITKALAKASKAAESSPKTLPPIESISKSSAVIGIHSTDVSHSWYISGQGACQRTKTNMNDCVIRQDIILLLMMSCSGEAVMALWCDVYCQTKDALFFRKFTWGFVAISDVDSLVRHCEGFQFFTR
jgi:hypothetical protein